MPVTVLARYRLHRRLLSIERQFRRRLRAVSTWIDLLSCVRDWERTYVELNSATPVARRNGSELAGHLLVAIASEFNLVVVHLQRRPIVAGVKTLVTPDELKTILQSSSAEEILAAAQRVLSPLHMARWALSIYHETAFRLELLATTRSDASPLGALEDRARVFWSCLMNPALFFQVEPEFSRGCVQSLAAYPAAAENALRRPRGAPYAPLLLAYAEAEATIRAGLEVMAGLNSHAAIHFQRAGTELDSLLNVYTKSRWSEPKPFIHLGDEVSINDILRYSRRSSVTIKRRPGGKRRSVYALQGPHGRFLLDLTIWRSALLPEGGWTPDDYLKVDASLEEDILSAFNAHQSVIKSSWHVALLRRARLMCAQLETAEGTSQVISALLPHEGIEELAELVGAIVRKVPNAAEIGTVVACCDFILSQLGPHGPSVSEAIRTGTAAALADLFTRLREDRAPRP